VLLKPFHIIGDLDVAHYGRDDGDVDGPYRRRRRRRGKGGGRRGGVRRRRRST